MNGSAQLPDIPKGKDFEEYVAAIFQSSGLFLERDVVERDGIEVLQLDAITTDYRNELPELGILEAKSGGWGFSDIFKVRGWMHYLDVGRGVLVAAAERDREHLYRQKAEKLGVDLVHIPEPEHFREPLSGLIDVARVEDVDVWCWRFWYWTERALIQRVRAQAKGAQGQQRFDAIQKYMFAVRSDVFFSETIAEKVSALYQSFDTNRHLAARCGVEIAKGVYGSADTEIPPEIFKRTFYDCEVNEIQTACMVEHHARLALLKAAVDYLSYKAAGEVSKAERIIRLKVGRSVIPMPLVSFPRRFEEALEQLATEPHYRCYPVFWQWFLGPFGGFLLADYRKEEVQRLADRAGMPVDAVPDAFSAYERLFPVDGGWMRKSKNAEIEFLLLYPVSLAGIGANYRRVIHTDSGRFEDLALKGMYTLGDLRKWNDAAVSVLTD